MDIMYQYRYILTRQQTDRGGSSSAPYFRNVTNSSSGSRVVRHWFSGFDVSS